jgi:hypothetical protein
MPITVEYQGATIDLTPPWRRVTMHDIVRDAMPDRFDFAPLAADGADGLAAAKAAAAGAGVGADDLFKCGSVGEVVNACFEELCEEHIVQPTFVTDYPVEVSARHLLAFVARDRNRTWPRRARRQFEPGGLRRARGGGGGAANTRNARAPTRASRHRRREKGRRSRQIASQRCASVRPGSVVLPDVLPRRGEEARRRDRRSSPPAVGNEACRPRPTSFAAAATDTLRRRPSITNTEQPRRSSRTCCCVVVCRVVAAAAPPRRRAEVSPLAKPHRDPTKVRKI